MPHLSQRSGTLTRRLLRVASAVGASVLVATGCASAGNPPDRVVGDFAAAVGRGDGSEACRLLAPSTRSELERSAGTPCATALLDEVDEDMGGALNTEVYGDQAQVRLERDTAFLAEFPDGWRVVAVACTAPRSDDRVYDCRVKGA